MAPMCLGSRLNVVYTSLELWKDKFAFKAKFRVLVEALLKIGSADQAEQVCRLLVSQQPSESVV